MAPEVKIERASAVRNHAVIRANPNQIAVLKASYDFSKSPSQDQLTALSEQTGLTVKWISQWFARQRTKDRKNNPDASARAGYKRLDAAMLDLASSSSDSIRSAGDILQVKLETADPVGLLPSSPGGPSGSEFTATVSASSSTVLSMTHPGVTTTTSSKKKRQTAPRNKTKASKNKTKGSVIIESSRVKRELVEVSLSENNHSLQPAPNSGVHPGDNYTRAAVVSTESRPTASANYHDILPMLGPPKRSPLTTGINHRGVNTRHSRSGLSTNKPHTVYACSSVNAPETGSHYDDTQVQDSFVQTRPTKSHKAVFYQQGPVFRTQFQNNGPSNYMPSPPQETTSYGVDSMPSAEIYNYSTIPSDLDALPSSSSVHVSHQPSHTIPFPLLVPAYGWENQVPFGSAPIFSKSDAMLPQHQSYQPIPHFVEQFHPQQVAHATYTGQDIVYADDGPPIQPDYSVESVPHALDPLHAPVKYLRHILDEFRDEEGKYIVNEELTARLVGEDIVEQDPFQAAMGLAFLSRVGVEW